MLDQLWRVFPPSNSVKGVGDEILRKGLAKVSTTIGSQKRGVETVESHLSTPRLQRIIASGDGRIRVVRGRSVLFLALLAATVAVACQRGPVRSTGTLLEVRGQIPLQETAAAKAAAIPDVTRVEKYLVVSNPDHAVIGVEPGATLRLRSGGQFRPANRIEAGRSFEAGDVGQKVAILGLSSTDMSGMTAMRIPAEIGATFELVPGVRPQVIGRFTVPRDIREHFIFLPLDVAQTAYNRTGQLSHLFVTVDASADVDQVKRNLEAILGAGITFTKY